MTYMTDMTFMSISTLFVLFDPFAFFLLFFNKDFKYLPLFCRLNPGNGPLKQ
jgi:hypothetical protein